MKRDRGQKYLKSKPSPELMDALKTLETIPVASHSAPCSDSVDLHRLVRLLARWRETLAWMREMQVLRRSEDNHTGALIWETQAQERQRCISELELEIGAGKEPNVAGELPQPPEKKL